MILISSRSNPKIKYVRSLRQHKGRAASGVFIVEGIHHVGEAVSAKADIQAIYYAPDLLSSEFAIKLVNDQMNKGVNCIACNADVFASISDREKPQGILALVHLNDVDLQHLTPQNFSCGVALVAPQDPGNVGTILRTIDAVGADGLILLDSSVDWLHPTLVRASMGSIFWYPIARTSFVEFEKWVNKFNYEVIGTSAHGSQDFRKMNSTKRPVVLLMGSEREGLTEAQRKNCSQLVRIPMRGHTTSLNLAVATGIMLYTLFAQSDK